MKEPKHVTNPGTYPTPAPHDGPYLSARWEAMTQPDGPLDEGDQALVKAVNRLPAGINDEELDGSKIKMFKDSKRGGDMVSLELEDSESVERIEVRVRKNPRTELVGVSVPDIEARLSRFSGERNEVRRRTVAYGNMITRDGAKHKRMRKNRAAAQLFKLEVARKIDQTRENMDSAATKSIDQSSV